MELLTVEDLNFVYPDQPKKVLDNVSFSVVPGEFVVLCGESGCGKTTLLRLLKRELAPHGKKSGSIRYNQIKQENLDDRTSACEIGYVMQNPENQIVTDKVWHELAFGLENMGLPNSIIRRRVGEMACFFGIEDWFRKPTAELSGGQKQLLNLASIMAMQPRLLILDEPTSQLDPIAATEFISTLFKLNRELGLTILLTEHRLEEVFPVADKVAVMEKGKILLWDEPRTTGRKLKELKENHRMLIGFPSAIRIYNGLEGTGECPLTVREGKQFLSEHYSNEKVTALNRELPGDLSKRDVVLSAKNIWFRYEREEPDILEDVSLSVGKGEIVSLLGGNGSGKTTLLSVMSGINHAYKGKIKILGKKLKDYKRNELYLNGLSLLPQNPQSVFLKQTVHEDYQELRKVINCSETEMEEQIGRITALLGIEELMDKHPYDLSGGEQQKAALGKVLMLNPRVLLLDEPTKGIDAYFKHNLAGILKNLKQQGVAILMVTHDVEFAASVSDRCGMFFDKEVTSLDEPVQFFCNNSFYTTAANRIARHMFQEVVTCDDVVELCRLNGGTAV